MCVRACFWAQLFSSPEPGRVGAAAAAHPAKQTTGTIQSFPHHWRGRMGQQPPQQPPPAAAPPTNSPTNCPSRAGCGSTPEPPGTAASPRCPSILRGGGRGLGRHQSRRFPRARQPVSKPGTAGWVQPPTSLTLAADWALKHRAGDALCKLGVLQSPPRAILLTGYLSPASLQAPSSLHKHLHRWNQLPSPEVACVAHGEVLRAPRGVCHCPLPVGIGSPPHCRLNFNLRTENLFEAYITKIPVMAEGLQKDVFPLKNSFHVRD